MSTNTPQKRVLITGCSSGFGLYTAVEAAKKGYDVIATMRNLDKKNALESLLAQAGVTAVIDQLDVTDPDSIARIAEKYKPIDILVNNAGILIAGSILTISDEEMRRIFETNYFGAVHLIQKIAPQMIESGGGRIINIASLAGLVGHMYNAAYSASKHALVGLSESILTELRPFNIDVVSIEPGYHKTEIIRANANVSDSFYDKKSPFFDYNRGFLKLMLDEVVPRAGEIPVVVDKIIEAMEVEKPKLHYVIGKEARIITIAKWLGLLGLLEKHAYKKLKTSTRREKRRAENRRAARKAKRSKNALL
jgi:NAD(P)-dependent dehydrogenase (short-subunit alcohol dehydrogenase family)